MLKFKLGCYRQEPRILTKYRRMYKLGAESRHPALLPNYSPTLVEVQQWRRAPKTGAPPKYLYPLPTLRQL